MNLRTTLHCLGMEKGVASERGRGYSGILLCLIAFTGLIGIQTDLFAAETESKEKIKIGVARLAGDDKDSTAQKSLVAALAADAALKGVVAVSELSAPVSGATPEAQGLSAIAMAKTAKASVVVGGEVTGDELQAVVVWVSSETVKSQRDYSWGKLPKGVILPMQSVKKPELVRFVNGLAWLTLGDVAKAAISMDAFLGTIATASNAGDITSQVASAYYGSYASTGDATSLQKATDTLSKALKSYQGEKNGVRQADTQSDLGVGFQELASLGIDPEKHLRLAVMATLEAVQFRKKQGDEGGYGASEKGLGQSYQALAALGVEPEQNLNFSINAFKEAGRVGETLKNNRDYLDAQNNIGVNYRELARWGVAPQKNLENALSALKEAAQFIKEKKEGEGAAAVVQNNIGMSYQAFAQWGIEPEKNLKSSLEALKGAAEFEKKQPQKKGYAAVQHNIGVSHQALAQWGVEPKQNLTQSLAALEEAATIRKEERDDVGYSITQQTLGTSYRALAQQGVEPEQNLNRSIIAFQEMSDVNKKRDNLAGYAAAQNELGITYKALADRGVDSEKNIRRSIDLFMESAKILKDLKQGGSGYAMAQNHIGLGYQALADRGIDPEENKKRADEAFEASRGGSKSSKGSKDKK